MAEVVKGLGVVWGTNLFSGAASNGNIGTVSGTRYGVVQSVRYSIGSDVAEVKGDDAEVLAIILSNVIENITVEVVPTGATIATAVANNILPTIGDDVVITDTGDSELTSTTFMFLGGDKNRTVDGAATLTFNLRRYGLATKSTVAAS